MVFLVPCTPTWHIPATSFGKGLEEDGRRTIGFFVMLAAVVQGVEPKPVTAEPNIRDSDRLGIIVSLLIHWEERAGEGR